MACAVSVSAVSPRTPSTTVEHGDNAGASQQIECAHVRPSSAPKDNNRRPKLVGDSRKRGTQHHDEWKRLGKPNTPHASAAAIHHTGAVAALRCNRVARTTLGPSGRKTYGTHHHHHTDHHHPSQPNQKKRSNEVETKRRGRACVAALTLGFLVRLARVPSTDPSWPPLPRPPTRPGEADAHLSPRPPGSLNVQKGGEAERTKTEARGWRCPCCVRWWPARVAVVEQENNGDEAGDEMLPP